MEVSRAEIEAVVKADGGFTGSVAGYHFKDGSYLRSDQYKAYRAKLDEIAALAAAIRKGAR